MLQKIGWMVAAVALREDNGDDDDDNDDNNDDDDDDDDNNNEDNKDNDDMMMIRLVSSTLHPLLPLPLQLDHGARVHLVVLEPDCQDHHHDHDCHDVVLDPGHHADHDHDRNHVHLYPPSSVCLTPIQTGLSAGKTRCSSSTRRWKSSI